MGIRGKILIYFSLSLQRQLSWCPGVAQPKAPLASAAGLQARLQRMDSSLSGDGKFEEIPKDQFLSMLDEEEEEEHQNSYEEKELALWSRKPHGVCSKT